MFEERTVFKDAGQLWVLGKKSRSKAMLNDITLHRRSRPERDMPAKARNWHQQLHQTGIRSLRDTLKFTTHSRAKYLIHA